MCPINLIKVHVRIHRSNRWQAKDWEVMRKVWVPCLLFPSYCQVWYDVVKFCRVWFGMAWHVVNFGLVWWACPPLPILASPPHCEAWGPLAMDPPRTILWCLQHLYALLRFSTKWFGLDSVCFRAIGHGLAKNHPLTLSVWFSKRLMLAPFLKTEQRSWQRLGWRWLCFSHTYKNIARIAKLP